MARTIFTVNTCGLRQSLKTLDIFKIPDGRNCEDRQVCH